VFSSAGSAVGASVACVIVGAGLRTSAGTDDACGILTLGLGIGEGVPVADALAVGVASGFGRLRTIPTYASAASTAAAAAMIATRRINTAP